MLDIKRKSFSTALNVVKKGTVAMLCMVMIGLFLAVGCKKTTNSTDIKTINSMDIFAVEGTIVAFVPPCQGNGVLISVENIENFGETGDFMYNLDSLINYQNAILVPHFDKNDDLIITSISIGDKLRFECRIAEEADHSLFLYDEPCPAVYGTVSAPCYVITKFLNH